MNKVIQFDNGSNGVNTTIGFVCGILGGCAKVVLTSANMLMILPILSAMLTALLCGAAGVAGKEFYLFIKKQIKAGNHKAIYPYLKKKLSRKKIK